MPGYVFRSTDAGAPVLTGQSAVGGFFSLLKACLVDGYGTVSSAGWAVHYNTSNAGAFRAPTGTCRHYLWVDDTSTYNARGRGFVTMSAANTGTDPFPTDGQLSGGLYFMKSTTTDATDRPWMLVATDKYFYLTVYPALTDIMASAGYQPIYFFGEIESNRPGDTFQTLVIGNTSTSQSSNNMSAISASFTVAGGHYMPRSHTQIGTSVQVGKMTDTRGGASTIGQAATGAVFPDPVSGGMLLAPIYVVESSGRATRGTLPGMFNPIHDMPGNPMDTIDGRGALAGRSFILWDASSGGTRGRVVIETTP